MTHVPHSGRSRFSSRRAVLQWGAGAGAALAVFGGRLPNFGISQALAADLGEGDVGILNYAYALEQCDVDPMAAMLVAVHPWDIDGAARAGLATAWINRTGGPYPGYFRGADIEVGSLTELADQLAG